MSYLSPEFEITPKLFKQLQIIKNMSDYQFSTLIHENLKLITNDQSFLNYSLKFSGLVTQRIQLIASLLYTQRAITHLKQKSGSKALIFVCCYAISCDMQGISINLQSLSGLSGFIKQRLSIAKLCVLQILKFDLYVKKEDFDEFLGLFLSSYEEEINNFQELTFFEAMMEPKEMEIIKEIENDNYLQGLEIVPEQIRQEDVLMFDDIWLAL